MFHVTVTDPTGLALVRVAVDPNDLAALQQSLLLGVDLAEDSHGDDVAAVRELIDGLSYHL